MTLSQRLTRAGLTFIILGTAAAIVPENSIASAVENSANCSTTSMTNHYAVYIPAEGPTDPGAPTDPTAEFATTKSITLDVTEGTSADPTTGTTNFTVAAPSGFTAVQSGSQITVTNVSYTSTTPENVVVTFFDTNTVVDYPVAGTGS